MDWLKSPPKYTSTGLLINDCSIVERWERPIQEMLVVETNIGPSSCVLEIGYGLGYAASKIEDLKPFLHFVVEAHPAIAKKAKEELGDTSSIVVALWEDIVSIFRPLSFDAIIFDAYPIQTAPYDGSKESTLNFAGVFTRVASDLLKEGGKLSFLDFSCQLHLLPSFHDLIRNKYKSFNVVPVMLEIPTKCTYAKGNKGHVIVLIK